MSVFIGKEANLAALKWKGVDAFRDSAARYRAARERLLHTMTRRPVSACPICGAPATESIGMLEVYGLGYRRCGACAHGFVATPPSPEESLAFYAGDAAYAATYTDRALHELRLREIYQPKAAWLVDEYQRLYGRKPHRLLDIGAGAGHFVVACRQLGIEADGVEPNASSVAFCREMFGIELKATSFLDMGQECEGFDVVTFWGVIEHQPDPLQLLSAARGALAPAQSCVLIEVPHALSFGTYVQALFPESITRHCDPFSHLHLFSAQSASLAFEKCGFVPVTAWYFGMDAFEMVSQLALALESDEVFAALAAKIPTMQGSLDRNKLSDSLILVGKPSAR